MNTYLIAYGCEPDQGGEHQVGWKLANTLYDKCNLMIIFNSRNAL